ncbi:chemotaxis protein CheW [Acidihalobacter yilgarnensis]|uniref:Chemotaxis protein CheW n=1 Tax=Acidihalobacter yilgarnensis TaxID=2819280 RepID=A0A1D8IPR4_9GAMM|nr:chemotaxis protein CheW [Acidihalobacter yilgarnensis]AOU98447.1 chemotaxis protein CheW [Acidihalobacter yilgarnensis]
MAEKSGVNKVDELQCVTFFLSGEVYALDVMRVQEVLRVGEISPVPGAPEYVLGIINLRGNVVTVIDARQRLGLEFTEPDDSSRIIVLEAAGQDVGILVDGVAEVVRIRQDEIDPSPSVGNQEAARYIQGVASRDKELIIVVDVEKLLNEEEWAELATM